MLMLEDGVFAEIAREEGSRCFGFERAGEVVAVVAFGERRFCVAVLEPAGDEFVELVGRGWERRRFLRWCARRGREVRREVAVGLAYGSWVDGVGVAVH